MVRVYITDSLFNASVELDEVGVFGVCGFVEGIVSSYLFIGELGCFDSISLTT